MQPAKPGHVVVGLSGGVDSAVAALLLKQQGYQLTAVFMKNWEEDDRAEYCAAEEDLKFARKVAQMLDIPLKTVNFSAEYWDRVFEYFLHEYRSGRTPNPDVLCNKEIKFRAFLDYALTLGADSIATGHYAGVSELKGRYQLLKANDAEKDQTYFLHALGQHELAHSLFPLHTLTKPEVRDLAGQHRFPNHDRKDSTGICFIGERRFNAFLAQYVAAQPGDIRSLSGQLLGQHQGLMFHTIGQRQGLGIGGAGEPWYVADKDLDANILYVVQGAEHPALFSHSLLTEDIHWISGKSPDLPLRCTARIRHRHAEQDCEVFPEDQGARVTFTEPQRAITPGQFVVFYDKQVCLGGGIIRRALKEAGIAASAPSARSGAH